MPAIPEDTQIETAYYVGTKRHSWRAGKPLQILGIVVAKSRGINPRPAYKVRDPEDKEENIIPMDVPHAIISESDIKAHKLPPMTDEDPQEPVYRWYR